MKEEHPAVTVVREFLAASMAPDAVKASGLLAPGAAITFTGGRVMPDVQAVIAFNAGRYAWVKKSTGPFDWMERGETAIVYSTGTLYGQWPDGRSFSGNRYLDRYEVTGGRITRMDVWNDSAEWLLTPGIAKS